MHAVVEADEHDEADWIEWKSELDLTSKRGCFHIARAILGMANRLPERATLTCQGLGFVIIGASPGNLAGVATVDPAHLDQLIEPYVGGADGPRYTAVYVPVDSVVVLVVTVEPPKPGDRIHVLQREFPKYDKAGSERGSYPSGALFVRKHGRTVQADATDHAALQDRLVARPSANLELDVELVGDMPLSWFDGDSAAEVVERWVRSRRSLLVQNAEGEERRRNPQDPDEAGLVNPTATALQNLLAQQAAFRRASFGALTGFGGEEDTRTLEEFIEQVDSWAERLTDAAVEALPNLYLESGHGVVAVAVTNPTGRFFPDVELEIYCDWEPLVGLDEIPDPVRPPHPPRPYGEPTSPPNLFGNMIPRIPDLGGSLAHLPVDVGRRTWVEEGSVRIRFDIGDLRQHASDTGDDVYLVLPARPDDGKLHFTWKATVPNVEGVLTGSLAVDVAERPVDLTTLIEPWGDGDT